MGQTQFATGTANVRASCILRARHWQRVGRSAAAPTSSAATTNVQGATDLGLDIVTLPLYYGLAEDAWRHWSRVGTSTYDWIGKPLRQQDADGDAGHPEHALV